MRAREYDAIIVGASFAGLAVARELLALAQWAVIHMPDRWRGPLAEFAAHPRIMPRWWPRYSRFGSLRAPGLLAGTLAKGRSTA